MIIFPAVDIQKGRAVRLKQGRSEEATVFAENPLEAALHWQNLGAKWLHVVDLDGAFKGEARNFLAIKKICENLSIPVQVGGGIRDLSVAQAYFDVGVSRLIIGTMALEQPQDFASLCTRFPKQIGVSLDAENGLLKTRGWLGQTNLTLDTVLPNLEEAGASFIIYTDILRDGMQTGINLQMLEHLIQITHLPILAAGGVATLKDIQLLYPLSLKGNLAGVISGKALYEGTLKLDEAMNWIQSQQKRRE